MPNTAAESKTGWLGKKLITLLQWSSQSPDLKYCGGTFQRAEQKQMSGKKGIKIPPPQCKSDKIRHKTFVPGQCVSYFNLQVCDAPQGLFCHHKTNIVLVSEVRLVETSSVQHEASLPMPSVVLHVLQVGGVRYAAAWSVPCVRCVGRRARLLHLRGRNLPPLLQFRGLLRDLEQQSSSVVLRGLVDADLSLHQSSLSSSLAEK